MTLNHRLLVSFASSLLIAAGWTTAAFAGPVDSAPSIELARGGCGAVSPVPAAVRGTWKTAPSPRAQAMPRDISYTSLKPGDEQPADSSVVGFWQIQFISEGNEMIPDGTVLDSGYAQWHQDGTEIMNSMRPPATSNFCLGVWRRAGGSTYDLNHFALSWDMSGVFVGPANIRERITVSHDGQTYEGTFSIDQYNASGEVIHHVQGRVTATRITVDTRIQ